MIDSGTWNHFAVSKQMIDIEFLVLDHKTWNYLNVCK